MASRHTRMGQQQPGIAVGGGAQQEDAEACENALGRPSSLPHQLALHGHAGAPGDACTQPGALDDRDAEDAGVQQLGLQAGGDVRDQHLGVAGSMCCSVVLSAQMVMLNLGGEAAAVTQLACPVRSGACTRRG